MTMSWRLRSAVADLFSFDYMVKQDKNKRRILKKISLSIHNYYSFIET